MAGHEERSLDESTEKQRASVPVLIVEDNFINREMLKAILEDDFEVLEAENGLVGLQQLEEHYEDLSLVLLDVLDARVRRTRVPAPQGTGPPLRLGAGNRDDRERWPRRRDQVPGAWGQRLRRPALQ